MNFKLLNNILLFLKAGANIKRFLYKAIPFVVFFSFFFKS